MYCLESEWFSWPWIRPSSFCRTGIWRSRQSHATDTPESPARLSSVGARPWQPCCQREGHGWGGGGGGHRKRTQPLRRATHQAI
uniref:Uncharacterized protein n=1 Tax=Esox lucius TaxID=8010 RepID=A0AAY5KXK0_ESOLU